MDELQELECERRFSKGPSGSYKNLISAADGAKPELVLRDAVNNDVGTDRHADSCLVFTDPLPPQGLPWRQMVTWWTENHQPGAEEKTAADALYRRLYRSLDSPPEQLVTRTYCARYAEASGRRTRRRHLDRRAAAVLGNGRRRPPAPPRRVPDLPLRRLGAVRTGREAAPRKARVTARQLHQF